MTVCDVVCTNEEDEVLAYSLQELAGERRKREEGEKEIQQQTLQVAKLEVETTANRSAISKPQGVCLSISSLSLFLLLLL